MKNNNKKQVTKILCHYKSLLPLAGGQKRRESSRWRKILIFQKFTLSVRKINGQMLKNIIKPEFLL
jgi:hypothetical protein